MESRGWGLGAGGWNRGRRIILRLNCVLATRHLPLVTLLYFLSEVLAFWGKVQIAANYNCLRADFHGGRVAFHSQFFERDLGKPFNRSLEFRLIQANLMRLRARGDKVANFLIACGQALDRDGDVSLPI